MKIIRTFPPNFTKLARCFPIKGKQGVLYAWGDTIYNPSGIELHPWLYEHEKVHSRQQGSNIDEWWKLYINDPKFRLAQEVPAHAKEYAVYRQHHSDHDSEMYLMLVSQRLSSALYGKLVDEHTARELITEGVQL